MLLDTSFCIDLLREQKKNKRGPAIQKIETLAGVELFRQFSFFVNFRQELVYPLILGRKQNRSTHYLNC